MKTSTRLRSVSTGIGIALATLLLATAPTITHAVEGAIGRPISGAGIMPYAGLIPPEPGLMLSVGEMYYAGDIGGAASVPIAGNLSLGIDATASFTPITAAYVWNTSGKQWNFASGVSLPLVWIEVEADVSLGRLSGRVSDDDFGAWDLLIMPISASYHISETDHLAFTLNVWAPTGRYDTDRLANLGLNTWTFIPTIAYTKIFPKANVELSVTWGVEFYTENDDTDYQNGVVSDLELLLIKRWSSGLGFGVIGSYIDQFTEDEGGIADRLGGFKGRAFGVGPILTYSTKVGDSHLDIGARWVPEFENKNRVEGDLLMFTLGWKF